MFYVINKHIFNNAERFQAIIFTLLLFLKQLIATRKLNKGNSWPFGGSFRRFLM